MSDQKNIEYHWKHDGWLRCDRNTGSCRYLTWYETILFMAGLKP